MSIGPLNLILNEKMLLWSLDLGLATLHFACHVIFQWYFVQVIFYFEAYCARLVLQEGLPRQIHDS